MWEAYYTPASLDDALRLLAKHGNEARIVAGATDLILELERGLRAGVTVLIDITRIPGLDHITLDEEGWIHLGPLVTHNHCAGSTLLRERAVAMARACWQVGAPQIRNRGTIAGNVITASPANDTIPPLMALGASVTLRSVEGTRTLPLGEFYKGVRQTAMRADEVLTDIAFPAPSEGGHSAFYKLGLRRAQAISVVNAAGLLQIEGKVVRGASLTLGSVAPTIIHARQAESFLEGKELTADVIAEAGDLAAEAATPIDDVRGSAAYRREMVRVCTVRVLRAIASGKPGKGLPDSPVMLWGPGEYHVSGGLDGTLEHRQGVPIDTVVNGKRYVVETGQRKTLLRMLREDLGLVGTKEGCAEGECGACTVFLDGMAVMSCMVPAPRAHGSEVVTIEGLESEGKLHPVQEGFVEQGAVQCGYCTPGFVMSGAKLLEERAKPTRDEIAQAITGNLCRCTGYYKIIAAIESAAMLLQQEASAEAR